MASTLDPSAVLGQLLESYVKLPLVQKIAFPLLIAGAVLGIVFVSKWAAAPDYSVLFSDLEPADASAVIDRLKEQHIKYQVRGDGSTIAISPAEMVHELRLSLAAEGIPNGGAVGFEIFDSTSLGTTSFVEKLKFLRAIQGELERTIVSLEVVSSVRVHITQPEKTVFIKQGSDPTASVMLKLRPGAELDKKQIKGIANLVAGSVEGLKPENVTIVDVTGNLLNTKENQGEELGIEATRLQYQQQIEKSYVQRIETMLAKVLGPEKVVARVSVDMDFTKNEREEESYDPGGQVVRSEKMIEEGIGTSQRGGIPGVVSNLTNDPNLLSPPGTGGEDTSRKEAIKNYEVSRAVTKTSSPRGKVVRLSAAVLVDGNYEVPLGAADGTPEQFVPLSKETMSQLESVVKSAIGYDTERGDTLTIENISFNSPDTSFADELDKAATQDLIFNGVSKGIPVLFILLFFFIVVRPLVKFMITPTEAEVDLSRLLPSGINELEQEINQERARAQIPEAEPSVDMHQLEEMMAENSRIVKDNPQQAALLIRYWLNDGRL